MASVIRRGASLSAAVSSSSSTEHVSMPVDREQQAGSEVAFHLNPTEPHNYQVINTHY